MTYTINFVNFTLGAPFGAPISKNLGWRGVCALPALYGSYAHGSDPVGDQTTTKLFGCGVLYGSNPRNNFTQINVISAKSTPGAAWKPRKRSKSSGRRGFALDSIVGGYSILPDPLAGGEGNMPSLRTTPLSMLWASLSGPSGLWPHHFPMIL